jgi:hypothetical protein
VAEGQTFNVGKLEVMRDPGTGEVLDQEIEISGKIKVSKVKEKLAICEVTQGNVKQGMTVMLLE